MKKKVVKKSVRKRSPKKVVKKRTVKKGISRKVVGSSKGSVDRMPSFVKNLDKLIGGGFIRESTNLVSGGSGSGKSVLVTQILIEGMLRGEKALYVTFEEKKDMFFKNMLQLGWDLAEFERKGLFIFLEYTPIKVKTMLEEGGGAIESIIVKEKVSRMAIDSISSFALLFSNELDRREAALNLFNMISRWSCTSFLTHEGSPVESSKVSSKDLEFESDCIILLYYLLKSGSRDRFLEILKMRGTDHSKKVFGFSISKGKGFVVDARPSRLPKR